MPDTLYFAYGSNLNLEQMQERCPQAQPAGPAILENYALLFRGRSNGYGLATIEPQEGSRVYGLLWRLTPDNACALDQYECYPRLYGKALVTVRTEIGETTAAAYAIDHELFQTPAIPLPAYYGAILEGYRQNGLPVQYLDAALKHTRNELRQDRLFHLSQTPELAAGSVKSNHRRKRQEYER